MACIPILKLHKICAECMLELSRVVDTQNFHGMMIQMTEALCTETRKLSLGAMPSPSVHALIGKLVVVF